jgi:hypothetical protein
MISADDYNTLAFRVAGLAGVGGFAFAYFRIGESERVQNDFYKYRIRISFLSAIFQIDFISLPSNKNKLNRMK